MVGSFLFLRFGRKEELSIRSSLCNPQLFLKSVYNPMPGLVVVLGGEAKES